MPLKVLAASYGVCSQDAGTHGQKHTTQSVQSMQANHDHAHLKNNIQAADDCKQCNLCHTACGVFVVFLGDGLLSPFLASQAVNADHHAGLKTTPSDPPYRPKWPTLA
jgi:hypothetical protein